MSSTPDPTATHPGDHTPGTAGEAPGAYRVLTMGTIAFTLMFAAWMMFGVLGVPIQK